MQADLLRLPEDLLRGEFDVVFTAWVQAWIGDLDVWFGSAWRALKPGGRFLFNGGHPVSHYVQEIEEGEPLRDSYFDVGPYYLEESPDDPWNLPVDPAEPLTTVEWGTRGQPGDGGRQGRSTHRRPAAPTQTETRSDYGVEYGQAPRPDRSGATKTGSRLSMASACLVESARYAFHPTRGRSRAHGVRGDGRRPCG